MKTELSQTKFARKHRERRMRRRLAGIKPNRRLIDPLSLTFIRQMNEHLSGQQLKAEVAS